MSEVKVNKISPRTNCGTVTLGDSGDTFTIPSGVTITNNGTQTGFGRTGAVDWQTTKITADPANAVSGTGYFTDTSGGAFNVTLPSSPSAGDIVAVADYAKTWDTNALTLVRNGSNIEGEAENIICNIEGSSITLVYIDATKGWVTVGSGNTDQAAASLFICATGGTITESGNCRIHTFTGPGTFQVNAIASVCAPTRNNVSYLVVAGGASGGVTTLGGAGGGAGGFREFKAPLTPYTASPLDGNPGGTSITIAAQGYPIVVGGGGAAGPAPGSPVAVGNPGSVSTFSTVTSAGGGGGAGDGPSTYYADPGGSGGGGYGASTLGPGGTGNNPPVSPPQGNNGGPAGSNPSNYANTGGGGGATAAGEPITGNFPGGGPGGNGGAGATTSISGSPTAYAGGGGGSADNRAAGRTGGDAGTGGGGQGGDPTRGPTSGTDNTGGGGGGQHGPSNPSNTGPSGAGGSGIVIIRYKYQ